MIATREHLRDLVERLPERQIPEAVRRIEELAAEEDPVLRAFLEAPEDDEPLTEEEREAIAEADRDFAEGRTLSAAEVWRTLGLPCDAS
jgi:hypothetical protein